MADWDPELYNRFRRYRAEPVAHILSRLQLADDEKIIDLGCGSGENTLELARRSPRGTALGVDGSPAMIEAARKLLDAEAAELKRRVSFELLDVPEFRADRAYSLIFSNATFQWIPDHRALFAACFDALRPGGTIVVQMPANETETAKMEIGKLAREAPWNTMLGGRERAFHEEPPEFYAAMLAQLGYDRHRLLSPDVSPSDGSARRRRSMVPIDRPAPFPRRAPERSSHRISRSADDAAQRRLRHFRPDDVRLQAAVYLGPPAQSLRWLARAIVLL